MRSFTLSLFATLFFGAVSSATPLPQSGNPAGEVGSLGKGADPITNVASLLVDTVGDLLDVRATAPPRGVAAIIIEAQSKLTPLTAQIAGANTQGDALGPIADQIQAILGAAATEIQHLAGQPTDIILGAANGVGQVTVEDLGRLVTDLLKQVVGALGHLSKALGPKIGKLIHDLLRDLVKTIADLLCNVKSLVSGIDAHLLPAIHLLLRVVLNLNLGDILDGLNLA